MRTGNAAAWNEWRRDTDIFGDLLKTQVDLSEVGLRGADLRGFLLVNTNFYKADLERSIITDVDCAHASFYLTRLVNSDLSNANLRGAQLSRAYLRGAKLDNADLRGADLRRASVTGASLYRADISGTDLSSTRGLTQDQIDLAFGDSETRLPDHIIRPSTWTLYGGQDDSAEDLDLANLSPLAATVEVEIKQGVVSLAQNAGDASIWSHIDPARIRREILTTVQRILPRLSNAGELAVAMATYAEEIDRDDYDIIILGLRGASLESVFESLSRSSKSGEDFDLMEDVKGTIRGILVQHFLFVSQSHKWRAFIEQASQSPYRREHREEAVQIGSALAAKLLDHGDACDPRLPTALKAVSDEANQTDDGRNLSVFNAFASAENMLRSLVSWVVREANRLGHDVWDKFRDKLAEIVGAKMAALVTSVFGMAAVKMLPSLFPERFGWLKHITELLFDRISQ